MKKILIVIDNLNTGGVATSLYNYLVAMSDKANYDLLVFDEDSIKLNEIPTNVNVLTTQRTLHMLGKTNREMQKESKILACIRIILQIVAKYINGFFARKMLMPFIKSIGEYDLAIAYSQDDAWKNWSKGCVDFVLKKTNAKKKAVIVHCDYKMFGGYDAKQEIQYKLLDNVICVSESCKKNFCECFPNLSEKTIVCENFINTKKILRMSRQAIKFPEKKINFVSISRISEEKGLLRIVTILAKLNKKGLTDFTWTIVGDGPEYDSLKKEIIKNDLQKKIVMVGQKENPYIYLKNADALLVPSFNEAAPMVYGESAVLGVPIITTETCSAIEMVEKRNLGFVIPNNSKGITAFLENILSGKTKLAHKSNVTDINENAFIQANKLINFDN